MNEDQIVEALDTVIFLPRRDTLTEVLKSDAPVIGSNIAKKLNISLTETLEHLEALERAGLVTSQKNSGTTIWHPSGPLRIEITISRRGIAFRESRLGFWPSLRRLLRF